MRKLLFIILIIYSLDSNCQSVTGTSGLINVPSARMLKDDQLVLGGSYIPKSYFQRYGRYINPGVNTFITYGILPFVELSFRYTHELNTPVKAPSADEIGYFPDRMFSIRYRLVNEKKYFPSIVLGLEDVTFLLSPSCKGCSNYSSIYFTFSKEIKLSSYILDLNFGFPIKKFNEIRNYYTNLFFGVALRLNSQDNISIIIENDSRYFNTGVKIKPIKNLNMMFGLYDFKKMTFSLNIFLR